MEEQLKWAAIDFFHPARILVCHLLKNFSFKSRSNYPEFSNKSIFVIVSWEKWPWNRNNLNNNPPKVSHQQGREKSLNISRVYQKSGYSVVFFKLLDCLYLIKSEAHSHIRLVICSTCPKSDFDPWLHQDENPTLIFNPHHLTYLNLLIIHIHQL